MSIVDGSLNPVPLCDLDQVLLKEWMAENHGLTLQELKKRGPEYTSVTMTVDDAYDELETPAVSPTVADADDHLSEIASAIPPVDPEVLTLRHNAFLAQLLLEEVDTESTDCTSGLCKPTVLTMKSSPGERIPLSGKGTAKPSPNNMPVFVCDIHILRSMLWARVEGIERATRLEHLKNT